MPKYKVLSTYVGEFKKDEVVTDKQFSDVGADVEFLVRVKAIEEIVEEKPAKAAVKEAPKDPPAPA